jgi:hypothetical protein
MRRTVLLMTVGALVLSACSGAAKESEAPKTPLPDSAYHMANLAEGESAALAAELVDVPGYFYLDVGKRELKAELEMASGMQALAASFHGVRLVSSGDEIAFLALFVVDPSDAVHSQAYEDRLGTELTGAKEVLRETFSGQTVFLAEAPAEPASRYKYVWDRQGTLGWADGPDRAALERWLEAYFATEVVLPGENPTLVGRLVEVPGFTYTNETRAVFVKPFTGKAFGGADYSAHWVFDKVHEFGAIVLMGPAGSLTERRFLTGMTTSLAESTGVAPVEMSGFRVNGVRVHRWLLSQGDEHITVYAWWWAEAGIGGEVTTERPDIGEPFLRAFLGAQRS